MAVFPAEKVREVEQENARLRREVAALRASVAKQRGGDAAVEEATKAEVLEMEAERHKELEAAEASVGSLRVEARTMSASAAALALGSNVSLEYTHDSPMFRRSATAFEETLAGLDSMIGELCERCRAWTVAQAEADAAARQVSAWLRDRRHARALFSSAHPTLGDLSETCAAFADDIDALTANRSELAYAISELSGRLAKFRNTDVKLAAELRDRAWRLGDAYETRLCETLKLDARDLDAAAIERLQAARVEFETARFGLVRHLNFIDARKKLVLSETVAESADAVSAYYDRGVAYFSVPEIESKNRLAGRSLAVAHERAALDDDLWAKVLDRLDAELRGELPPPGAPTGARAEGGTPARLIAAERVTTPDPQHKSSSSSLSRRRFRLRQQRPAPPNPNGAPPWSAALNTEVLSEASLAASRSDLAHARDEGILKQGYLHRRDIDSWGGLVESIASKNRRRWHRLHNGALYVVEDQGERRLCDLRGCAVHRGHQKTANASGILSGAFALAIVRPDGHRLAFQAENDDELIKWISALRRSTKWHELGAPSRRLPEHAASAATRRSTAPDDTLSRLAALAVDAPNARLVAQVALANPRCAECDATDPEWVAAAIGAVVCADCAALHRKLGASLSRLRALWLDRWSPLLLRYLLRAAGNKVANACWECSPPVGWSKPRPSDSALVKEEWIVAKYAWAGFIGDAPDNRGAPRATTNVIDAASRELAAAAFLGDVPAMMRAFARRGSATWRDPNNRQRTALHVASLSGNTDAIAYLLLNGGDAHQPDADNATPLSLASVSEAAVSVAQLILEYEQGELW